MAAPRGELTGAGGTALSGGERRRLAAARALLADLPAALTGRLVVCVTHDGLERPGDTVVRLSHSHPTVRAWV
jgi:ATP-binding cassette subfamily C protein CydCD